MWSPELYEACRGIVERFRENARSQHVFLLDQDGHVLVHAGINAQIDLYSTAALLASLTAASAGIARLVNSAHFNESYYEGEDVNLFSLRLSSEHILGVLFNKKETTLGLVRLRARHTLDRLEYILKSDLAGKETQFDMNVLDDGEIDRLLDGL